MLRHVFATLARHPCANVYLDADQQHTLLHTGISASSLVTVSQGYASPTALNNDQSDLFLAASLSPEQQADLPRGDEDLVASVSLFVVNDHQESWIGLHVEAL